MTAFILGTEQMQAAKSAVDAKGQLSAELIDGVYFRAARPVPHEDGHLTEVVRSDWELLGPGVAQVHTTTVLPGRIRAWDIHEHTTDRLFVARGIIKFVLYDGRAGSQTHGRINELIVSERSPGLLLIPPMVFHGFQNIGVEEAIILNVPNRLYNYDKPDARSWRGILGPKT